MIELNELAKILESNPNLSVEMTESGMVITDLEKQNEENNVPSDLVNFVSIYEREAIVKSGGGYVITVTNMSGPNFAKLLNSVFAENYEFTLDGEYSIIATPVSRDPKSVGSYNMESIAHAIDADGVEIEIHEDGLKVIATDAVAIAEKIAHTSNPVSREVNTLVTRKILLILHNKLIHQ